MESKAPAPMEQPAAPETLPCRPPAVPGSSLPAGPTGRAAPRPHRPLGLGHADNRHFSKHRPGKPEAKAGKKGHVRAGDTRQLGASCPWSLSGPKRRHSYRDKSSRHPDGQLYGSSGATNPSVPCALGALPRVTETDHGTQAGSKPQVRNNSYGTEVEPKTQTSVSLQTRRRIWEDVSPV